MELVWWNAWLTGFSRPSASRAPQPLVSQENTQLNRHYLQILMLVKQNWWGAPGEQQPGSFCCREALNQPTIRLQPRSFTFFCVLRFMEALLALWPAHHDFNQKTEEFNLNLNGLLLKPKNNISLKVAKLISESSVPMPLNVFKKTKTKLRQFKVMRCLTKQVNISKGL